MRVLVAVSALLLVALVAMSEASDAAAPAAGTETVEEAWTKWKATHKKLYGTPEEEARRFENFKQAKELVDAHNKKFEAGEVSYSLGLNDFSDLSQEEFRRTRLGFKG